MHSFRFKFRRRAAALVCACGLGFFAAGCHNNNNNSGLGVAWISLTNEGVSTTEQAGVPDGQFSSYIVAIDSVVLTGKVDGQVTAIDAEELIDLTKIKDISELWSAAQLPVDTYTTASITLDYTSAQISVMVGGVPVAATVVDPTGATPATVVVNVTLDPNNQFTLQDTYASSNALRMAFHFDMDASNTVVVTPATGTTAATAKVIVAPWMSVVPNADGATKPIRIKGPLVNSSLNEGTFSNYVRPFFDEVNALGSVSIFNSASTIYTVSGNTYVGTPGLTALQNSSAGSTITATYCTFQPTPTLTAGISAGIFYSDYVVAGSTLEDYYTVGIEGDVIARSGNTLTLIGATLDANSSEIVEYLDQNALVLLAPSTLLTADGVSAFPGLNYNSISVGAHIIARGIYSAASNGQVTIDATGTSATNTGSVRLISNQLYGSLNSTATGSLIMDLQNINGWPVSDYTFAGNGTTSAQDSNPLNYVVNTGTLTLPDDSAGNPLVAGDPVWVDGYTSPFGTAPPDFIAESVSAEQQVPASFNVSYVVLPDVTAGVPNPNSGTLNPFVLPLNPAAGLSIDLTNTSLSQAVIRVGAEVINLTAQSASPTIVPALPIAATSTAPGLPPVFMPVFSLGAGGIASIATNPILEFNSFSEFVTALGANIQPTAPATPFNTLKFIAVGLYDRSTNVFTASKIDVVLNTSAEPAT